MKSYTIAPALPGLATRMHAHVENEPVLAPAAVPAVLTCHWVLVLATDGSTQMVASWKLEPPTPNAEPGPSLQTRPGPEALGNTHAA